MSFRFSLLLIVIANFAQAADLQSVLSQRLQSSGALPSMDSEQTWAFSRVMPFERFEYRYGFTEDKEVHTFRAHVKSFTEIMREGVSHQLSQALLDSEKRSILNQRRFDVYLELVSQSLQGKMLKLLGGREAELQRSLKESGKKMGLPKADVKDLVRELERLQKVDAAHDGIKAQQDDVKAMSDGEVELTSHALVSNVGALAARLSKESWDAEQLQIERKRLESKLERLDKEISWSKDRKILDHVDLSHEPFNNQDTIRLAFNIPWLRFDNEGRARDKALLIAKERSLEREASELRGDLSRARRELFSLAAQVESMKARLEKTRGIAKKVGVVRDLELRSVLGDFSFDLEKDVLAVTLKFYIAYLEYLRDQGAFARFSDLNLLDPSWAGLRT